MRLKQFLIALGFLLMLSLQQLKSQTCASNSRNPWEWPGHNNWVVALNLHAGTLINFDNGTYTSIGAYGNSVQGYEGMSAASDDQGNYLFFTNGRQVLDDNQNETFGALLTGNENGATQNRGSASQGVITVRHPLNPEEFFVVTTDDANSGFNGLNYASFDPTGAVMQGVTNLGGIRTTEGISATLHENGVDVWVTVLESGTGDFYSYLLTCDGFVDPPEISSVGPSRGGQQERGGIAFSWDGNMLVDAHPQGGNDRVNIYDFDKGTGQITNQIGIMPAPNAVDYPYDVTFSPDNSHVLFSTQAGKIFSLDISSGVPATIRASYTEVAGAGSAHSAIEIGGDGFLYRASLGGPNLTRFTGNLNDGSVLNPTTNLAPTARGLPTIYIPPAEEPIIDPVADLCDTDPPINLSTNWVCSGLDAEDPVKNPNAYSGPGITNAAIGTFDPGAAGVGTHEIIFTYCAVDDTIEITVTACGSCEVDVIDTAEICVGESLLLDTMVLDNNGPGIWSIDSSAAGIGVNPSLDIVGGDTLFDASDLTSNPGLYKLKFEVTSGAETCYDSLYVFVRPLPDPTIDAFGPLCLDSVTTLLTADSTNGLDWYINDVLAGSSPTNVNFNPDIVGEGTHEVKVVVTNNFGCVGLDSIDIDVLPLPDTSVVPIGPFCANEADLAIQVGQAGGTWSATCGACVDNAGTFSPQTAGAGTHSITYSFAGRCGADSTIEVVVHPMPNVTIDPFGPLCKDSVITALTSDSTGQGGTSDWYIDNVLEAGASFNPNVLDTGDHNVKLIYTSINNCSDTDSINVNILPLPDTSVAPIGPFCAYDAGDTIDVSQAGGTWSATCGACIDQNGYFDAQSAGAGVHQVTYTFSGMCGADSTIEVVVYPKPNITIDPFGPLCVDSVPAIAMNHDSLGDGGTTNWYINGIAQVNGEFDAAAVDTGWHNIYATYTSTNNCSDSDSIAVQVLPVFDPTIDQVGPYCENEAAVQLSAVDTGGVWSGNGVDANGLFDPTLAGDGDHLIRYEFAGQCGSYDTMTIHVDSLKDATILMPDSQSVCADGAIIPLNARANTGTWSIAGADIVNFDPTNYTPADYEIIHTLENPCGDADTIIITVLPLKDASFNANQTVFCSDDDSIQFIAVQNGGTWSGPGINPNTGWFNPASANVGTYYIYYNQDAPCPDVDSVEITINPVRDATISGTPGDTMTYCILDPDPIFSVGEAGGAWNNPAVSMIGTQVTIDLGALGNVQNEMLVYTISNPCGDADTIWVTTSEKLDATINPAGPFCANENDVQLTLANPSPGTWTSNCATCLDADGVFSPNNAGAGMHTITYTIGGNCGDTFDLQIEVRATPDPTINLNPLVYCEYDDAFDITVNQAGGEWDRSDEIGNAFDTLNLSFDPELAGGGTFDLIYNFNGLCPAADTVAVTILDTAVIDLPDLGPYCESADPIALNATPDTGVWLGTGVAGDNFEPQTTGVGVHVITYEIQGACPVSQTIGIEVLQNANPQITPLPVLCSSGGQENLVASEAGGNWYINGNTSLNTFNPQSVGEGTHEVVYEIMGQCGANDTIEVEVVSAPNIQINGPDALCEGTENQVTFTANPAGGTWGGDVNANGELLIARSGTYEIIYEVNDVCTARDTIEFEVLPVPEPSFEGLILEGCIPFTETFINTTDTTGAGEIVASNWRFGNNLQSISEQQATTPYNQGGVYDVTLINTYENGCTDSVTYEEYITAYDIPTADFTWSPEIPTTENGWVQFENLSQNEEYYNWDFSEIADEQNSNTINPLIEFLWQQDTVVDISLIVSNNAGCADTIVKPLTYNDIFTVYIPNAFTPNGDGINDDFYPQGKNLPADEYHFMIFNRWGDLIWETYELYDGWDGTVQSAASSNEVQQVDVYVYKLVTRNPYTRERIEMVGTVTLLK